MKENTQKLIELIKENPDLPIIPMVFYEVVGEDYGNWVGRFSTCYVGEYTLFNDRYYEDREEFKEDYYDYYEEKIKKKCSCNPLQESKYLNEIAEGFFKKAIIVYIDSLD